MDPLDTFLWLTIAILALLLMGALRSLDTKRRVIQHLDRRLMELGDQLKASKLALDHARQALTAKRRIQEKIDKGVITEEGKAKIQAMTGSPELRPFTIEEMESGVKEKRP